MNGCAPATNNPLTPIKKQVIPTSETKCSTQEPASKNDKSQINNNDQSISNKDQSININIGGLPQLDKPIAMETQTLATIAKSGIKIETDTDWPAVSATIIVGITIAWLASTTQRSQIRSNIAHFRHDWLNDLRSKISEFIAKLALLHSKLSSDENFLKDSASDELYSEIVLLQTTIELMLDREKQSSKELTRLLEEIISTFKYARDNKKINELANKISLQASYVLEQAWQDICSDHGLKKNRKPGFFSFLRR